MITTILEVDERWIHTLWDLNLIQLLEGGGLFEEENIKKQVLYKIRYRAWKVPEPGQLTGLET